ncbi:acetoacetate--CoA ligase [Actinomadura nitritigenes]|uniref:acetoacetate--CoA ligase n=1 Tax=Actinomadura nitritigenes TaxID=134602 RepID=UPI003D90EED8
MNGTPTPAPAWTPAPDDLEKSRLADFARFASARTGHRLTADYRTLWEWSTDDLSGFWSAVWDFFGLPARPDGSEVLTDEAMPGARWFPGTELNLVDQVFKDRDPNGVALVAATEDGGEVGLTWSALASRVAAAAEGLRRLGVKRGDRVAGYLSNGPEAVVAFLATAGLGAIWAVCGLDYAPAAAQSRLGQLEPRVLVAGTGYRYGGKDVDSGDAVRRLARSLPGLAAVVIVGDPEAVPGAIGWDDLTADASVPLEPVPVPFDHPLWVLFSSGTTGRPKGIVHGHGGVLLEQLKCNGLHFDLREGDRMLWYTTPSWMMWNALVSSLLVGTTIVCLDGSPGFPVPDALWAHAARLRVTLLGTSPAYVGACRKAGVDLSRHDLSALRTVGITGSAFPADGFRWLNAQLPDGVRIVSSSGGTDVVTAFVGGAPNLPIWAGELSAPLLGVALAAFDGEGRPVRDEVGELVVTKPMPSMPVFFWNDPDGGRYRSAYFDTYPGVWRHGDWITITDRGSVIIHGRSDATLNRRGVRIGSSDIYAAAESIPQVTEGLVVGLEQDDGGYWMPLFVTLADGVELDDPLRAAISDEIAARASRRHVPDDIIAAPGVPHTRTGKKLEVPVKRILLGHPVADVVDPTSVDHPELLEWYAEVGAQRRARRDRSAL